MWGESSPTRLSPGYRPCYTLSIAPGTESSGERRWRVKRKRRQSGPRQHFWQTGRLAIVPAGGPEASEQLAPEPHPT